jgi:hypothetical protein
MSLLNYNIDCAVRQATCMVLVAIHGFGCGQQTHMGVTNPKVPGHLSSLPALGLCWDCVSC